MTAAGGSNRRPRIEPGTVHSEAVNTHGLRSVLGVLCFLFHLFFTKCCAFWRKFSTSYSG